MTSEPFRFDQQPVFDVSELNLSSGLRNSMNPLTNSSVGANFFKLGLSAEALRWSNENLGKSSDGQSTAPEPFHSSASAILVAHQNALNQAQSQQSAITPFWLGNSNSNNNNSQSGNRTQGSAQQQQNIPQPIISLPPSLQASGGPTIKDVMALGGENEALRVIQQAAIQSKPPVFNVTQYMNSQNSPTPTLRFSGDRFASSAFSPVSPGGSSAGSKPLSNSLLSILQNSNNNISNSTSLTPNPLSSPNPLATPSSQPFTPSSFQNSNSFNSNFNEQENNESDPVASLMSLANSATIQNSPNEPSSPNSSTQSATALGTTQASSSMMTPQSIAADSLSQLSYSPTTSSHNPLKRPFLGPSETTNRSSFSGLLNRNDNADGMIGLQGTNQNNPSPMTSVSSQTLPVGRHTPNSFLSSNESDHRTQLLLNSINTMNQGLALASNTVKQENMVQEQLLAGGVSSLKGPASSAFSHNGQAITFSEESATQHLLRLEEKKKAELENIQTHVRVRRKELNPNENYLAETYFEHRKTKKLSSLTYDAMFRALVDNQHGIREKYFLNEHPQVQSLPELPGMIYFLLVTKGSRKPPHVGYPFRSYSDSHYTSVDRDNPIICKVKEWPCTTEPKNIWRLYHYYLGNKKRAPRKRKRGEMDDGEDDE